MLNAVWTVIWVPGGVPGVNIYQAEPPANAARLYLTLEGNVMMRFLNL